MFLEYRLKTLRPLESNLGREQFDYRHTEQELINLSADGWEVVSIAPAGGEWVALLKRPTTELVRVDPNAIYT